MKKATQFVLALLLALGLTFSFGASTTHTVASSISSYVVLVADVSSSSDCTTVDASCQQPDGGWGDPVTDGGWGDPVTDGGWGDPVTEL